MKHFIVRIFDETASIDEVESREAQAQAFEEEDGGRSRILTIAALDDAGNSGSKHFANHRPGRLPGVLVVLAAGAAAIEHFASMEGLVDKLNAMEMGEGFAYVICSNGSIYPRNLTPVAPPETGSEEEDLDLGELLAGHPDDKGAEAASALLTQVDSGTGVAMEEIAPTETLVGDGTGTALPELVNAVASGELVTETLLDSVSMPPLESNLLDPAHLTGTGTVTALPEIDSAPATEGSTDAEAAPATSESSDAPTAQDAPPSVPDAAPATSRAPAPSAPQASGRKGRGTQASTSVGEV